MPRRTKQSNKSEWCPVCGIELRNRAAATSHYKRHVREGRLESRPGEYNIQQWANVTEYKITGEEGGWFERGFTVRGLFTLASNPLESSWCSWLRGHGYKTLYQQHLEA